MPARQPDLRKLARRQRWLLWLVLLGFVSQFLQFLPWGAMRMSVLYVLVIVQVALWLVMIVGVVLVVSAQGSHPAVTVLTGFLMLAPCAIILVLLLVSRSVNRTFRRAGVRVGFMGVNDADLERALNPMLCHGCGYDLTGNVTGICSECGRPASRFFCTTCQKLVEGSAGDDCPGCGRILS